MRADSHAIAYPPSQDPPLQVGWRAFAALMPGFLLSNLEGSLVNVALPDIQLEFGAPLEMLAWIPMACQLPTATLSVLMGVLADRLGRRRVYMTGLVLLGLGAILGALAPNLSMLLVARVLQGVGAAALIANGLAIVAEQFAAEERGRALGIMTATVGLGAILAPPLGGAVAEVAGWRAIFVLNLPVVLAGIHGMYRRIPADRPVPPDWSRSIPWGRAALLALSAGAGVLGLWSSSSRGVTQPFVLTCLGLAALGGMLFFRLERGALVALVRVQHSGARVYGSLLALSFASAMLGALGFVLPLFFYSSLGLSGLELGLKILPLPLGLVLGALLGGQLGDRRGRRIPVLGGLICFGAGLVLHGWLGGIGLGWIGLGLAGVGIGAFSVANNTELVHGRHREVGALTGLMGLLRLLGSVLGVALAGLVMARTGPETSLWRYAWMLIPALLASGWAYLGTEPAGAAAQPEQAGAADQKG